MIQKQRKWGENNFVIEILSICSSGLNCNSSLELVSYRECLADFSPFDVGFDSISPYVLNIGTFLEDLT